MSDFEEFDNQEPSDETPEEATERLRAELASGVLSVRPELAEALMMSARNAAEERHFDLAVSLVDEAVEIAGLLIEEGETAFLASAGRCLLFRAALIRIHQGDEAGLVAFNDMIRFLSERIDPEETSGQNELAIALMNKADMLIDPFGAHSAAIAAQGQAARIWRRLVLRGETSYRHAMISALLAQGDAKVQTGDLESALPDYQNAMTAAQEGLDADEPEFTGLLIQALSKLTKWYERIGDVAKAFETSAESIRLLEEAVAEGNDQAEPALTAFYFQRGALFERIGEAEAALFEYDRTRDVYLRMIRQSPLGAPADYVARTGLANVLMCRGNMLADLQRFDEATSAFDESIRRYRQATEFRPEDDDDETFIPYSIGVVRLNHANMLVRRERLTEAIGLKEEAIESLRARLEAGHREIIPNIVSAYRKMIGIRRALEEFDRMFREIDDLLRMLSEAVDEGDLEYRSDLAATYYLRAACREEADETEGAQQDFLHALRLFREVADDETESPEVQWSKLQWGEILERLATSYVRQGRVDDALTTFQKEIDEVRLLYDEGSEHLLCDVLFGDSQLVEFVDGFLREHAEEYESEDVRRWILIALWGAESGIELSRRRRSDANEESLEMFFRMKIAFFRQYRASFLSQADRTDEALEEFAGAASDWEALLDDTERLRLRTRYFRQEAESEQRFSERTEADDSTGDESSASAAKEVDPLFEKWKYYAGEYRRTLQRWALTSLSTGNMEEAERLFRRDLEMARDLVRRGIPHADRFLVLSLMTCAKAIESTDDSLRALPCFQEAARLIRNCLEKEEFVAADFSMFQHVYTSYATFLHHNGLTEEAGKVLEEYIDSLQSPREYPEPAVWIDLCRALPVLAFGREEAAEVASLVSIQLAFLARHPLYETSTEFRDFEKSLQAKDDGSQESGDRSQETDRIK